MNKDTFISVVLEWVYIIVIVLSLFFCLENKIKTWSNAKVSFIAHTTLQNSQWATDWYEISVIFKLARKNCDVV